MVSITFQGEAVQINKRQPRFHRGAFAGLHGFTELSLPCILSLLRRDLSGLPSPSCCFSHTATVTATATATATASATVTGYRLPATLEPAIGTEGTEGTLQL